MCACVCVCARARVRACVCVCASVQQHRTPLHEHRTAAPERQERSVPAWSWRESQDSDEFRSTSHSWEREMIKKSNQFLPEGFVLAVDSSAVVAGLNVARWEPLSRRRSRTVATHATAGPHTLHAECLHAGSCTQTLHDFNALLLKACSSLPAASAWRRSCDSRAIPPVRQSPRPSTNTAATGQGQATARLPAAAWPAVSDASCKSARSATRS